MNLTLFLNETVKGPNSCESFPDALYGFILPYTHLVKTSIIYHPPAAPHTSHRFPLVPTRLN